MDAVHHGVDVHIANANAIEKGAGFDFDIPGVNIDQPAQVYERVEVQLRACRLPRLMGLDLAKMPADHWPQLLKDQQEAGEVAAMQRAAQREYALYPELFAWDPADCDSIYELDEAERKALAVEMQELQHARARKVQESVNPVR